MIFFLKKGNIKTSYAVPKYTDNSQAISGTLTPVSYNWVLYREDVDIGPEEALSPATL